MRRSLILLGLVILTSSHELFLKSDSYFLSPDSESGLFLYNGSFDQSENIITRDRISDARVVSSGFRYTVVEDDFYDLGNETHLKFTTGEPGTYLAGISTLPRMIELSAEAFREYLEHEGLTDMILERISRGISDQDARELYSKHVKALLQVGDKTTGDFGTELGYPVEFIPLQNPYELTTGDQISFRLLKQGLPLSDEVVRFGSRPEHGQGAGNISSLRTDQNGEFSIPLLGPGQWYVASIHIEESNKEGVDYESNWATLSFAVR